MLYFELKGRDGTRLISAARGGRSDLSTTSTEKSYTVTLAVSLGQIKTLIENPFSMTHAANPGRKRNIRWRVAARRHPPFSGAGGLARQVIDETWKTPWKWSDRKDR